MQMCLLLVSCNVEITLKLSETTTQQQQRNFEDERSTNAVDTIPHPSSISILNHRIIKTT